MSWLFCVVDMLEVVFEPSFYVSNARESRNAALVTSVWFMSLYLNTLEHARARSMRTGDTTQCKPKPMTAHQQHIRLRTEATDRISCASTVESTDALSLSEW